MNVPAPSLGLIKPIIDDIEVSEGEPWDEKQLAKVEAASQPMLDQSAIAPLEPMPFSVKYRYHCESDGCRGHKQGVIDWELGQAGRSWLRGDTKQGAMEKIRKKWGEQMCGPGRDTHFFIGNQQMHRTSFMVLGTWWPKLQDLALF